MAKKCGPTFLRPISLIVVGLCLIAARPVLRAGEPAAPAKPERPQTGKAAPLRKGIVVDELQGAIEPFTPVKPETAEEKRRNEALAWFMAGRLKQADNRLSEAFSDYQNAIKLQPNSVEVYRALVPLAFYLNETEKGLQYAQKAIELDPQDLDILRLLAEQLHEQHKVDKAVVYLERALKSPRLKKHSSTYVLLQLQLAQLYLEPEARNLAKAADAYGVVFDARRNPSTYSLDFQTRTALERERLARFEVMGEVFLIAHRTTDAIEAFKAALKSRHGKAGPVSLSLAQAYFNAKQYDNALNHLQTYLDAQLVGRGRQPYELLAAILDAKGKSKDLLPRVEALAKTDVHNSALQYFLADQYVAAGRLNDAEAIVKRSLKESGDAEGYVSLAGIYAKQHKPGQLLEALIKGFKGQHGLDRLEKVMSQIQEDPRLIDGIIAAARKLGTGEKPKLDFFTAYLMTLLTTQADRTDAALEFYNQAIAARRDSEAELAKKVLVPHLLSVKRYQQAIDVLKKALAAPTPPGTADADALKVELLDLLARAQEFAGKTNDALASVHEAQKIDSTDPALSFSEAWVYYHSHQWDAAARRFQDLMQKYATEKRFARLVRLCRITLSNCYVQKGDLPAGEKILEQVLAEQPDDPSINNDLGYLYADQGKNLEKAEKMIRLAIKSEPKNVAYLDSMGWVLVKLGRAEEARSFLEKAAANPEGSDATIWEHLGDCYDRLKASLKANDAWKKALKQAQGDSYPDKKLIERLEEKLRARDADSKKTTQIDKK